MKSVPKMPPMDAFFLMHFLGETPAVGGTQNMNSSKAHITLLPFALIESDAQEKQVNFIVAISKLTEVISKIPVYVSGYENFGVDNKISVQLIAPDKSLQRMHDNLVEISELSKVSLGSPQYNGQAFRPHITKEPNHANLPEGSLLLVDTLTLARHKFGFGNGPIEVVAHFNLGLRNPKKVL